MEKKGFLLLMLMGFLLSAESFPQELGYRRITMKERVKEFYRTGGKAYLGKKVHIYIAASPLQKKPEIIRRPGGYILHRFANRSVPLLMAPNNIYYKRLLRKFKKEGKKIKSVSLYGRVIRPAWDLKGRCHILVTKMKSYRSSLMKTGG